MLKMEQHQLTKLRFSVHLCSVSSVTFAACASLPSVVSLRRKLGFLHHFFTRQHNKPHTAQFLNKDKMQKFIAAVKRSVNQQTGLILLFYTKIVLKASASVVSVSMGNLPNIILTLPLSFAYIKNIGQTPSLQNRNCGHMQLKAGLRARIWYILIFSNSSPRS